MIKSLKFKRTIFKHIRQKYEKNNIIKMYIINFLLEI